MKLRGKKGKIALALLLPFVFSGAAGAAEIPAGSIQGDTSKEVYVQTINAENTSYLINIGWGDMQFVYDYGYPTWNTTTMTYEGGGTEGWQEDYINGVNNQLQITNQSNAKIQVGLQFAMSSGALNWSATENSVVGYFYDTNEHALQASKILTGTTTATFTGKIDSLILETAAEYTKTITDAESGTTTVTVPAGARTASAYFAFSGTPDKDLSVKTSVGSISVVFSNYTE